MNMVFCRGCAAQIHETAPTCPKCGAVQFAPPRNRSPIASLAFVLAVLFASPIAAQELLPINKLATGQRGVVVYPTMTTVLAGKPISGKVVSIRDGNSFVFQAAKWPSLLVEGMGTKDLVDGSEVRLFSQIDVKGTIKVGDATMWHVVLRERTFPTDRHKEFDVAYGDKKQIRHPETKGLLKGKVSRIIDGNNLLITVPYKDTALWIQSQHTRKVGEEIILNHWFLVDAHTVDGVTYIRLKP